jgi:hypothetical protein
VGETDNKANMQSIYICVCMHVSVCVVMVILRRKKAGNGVGVLAFELTFK